MTSLDHWSHATDSPTALLQTIIRITPTRTFIERRFPTLGFTVDTGGLPFFEVLLATDRALFDPANASRRTPATFYASREHSGLMRAGDEPSVYLVPTAVIHRFAGAREIFYTAACYGSAQGQDPAYAIPPAQLSREAPSVGVASDFQGRALAASFAIPVDVLLRVRDEGARSSAALDDPDRITHAYGDSDRDADADRAGGEDGYGLSAAINYDDDYGPMSGAQQAADDETDTPADEPAAIGAALDYRDGYDDPILAASASASGTDDDANEDDANEDDAAASAQQSTYTADAPVPAMLVDEDEDRRDRDGAYAASAAYGDEGDEEAGAAPMYRSLDAPVPLTAREQRRIMDTILAVGWPCQDYAGTIPDTEPTSAPPAGLSFGIVPFMQWSGALGELLKTMEQRDARTFQSVFGPKWKDLRNTANEAKEVDRLKAVESKEFWREPWLTRFKKAGAHKAFQAAQNETAARLLLQPIVAYAYGLGLNTDRGLVMLAALLRRMSLTASVSFVAQRDAAFQSSLDATLVKLVEAVSPLKTDAQRGFAVNAVGTAFLKAQHIDGFQGWTAAEHLAVLAELRKIGRSPVPLPTRTEMLDLIVKYARDAKDPWASELAHLRSVPCLRDVEYAQ
jgi:hypothetical protein